jgi:long-chain acyl-CoA synthetase
MNSDTKSGRTLTIGDIFRRNASQRPGKTALASAGTALTFAQLDAQANQAAQAIGAAPGERIAFLGKNSPQYFVLMGAAAKLGAVLVPLNWRLAYPEIVAILRDARVRLVLVEREFRTAAERLRDDTALNLQVLTVPDDASPAGWYASAEAADPGHQVAAGSAALQLYTSGTTGRPKGVLSTHAAVLDSCEVLSGVAGIGPGSVSLATLPTFHIGGTSWALTGLWAGCTTVLLRDAAPHSILAALTAHQVTVMIAVPSVIATLLDALAPGDRPAASLARLYYGGGPMTNAVLQRAMAALGCEFVQGFGMTELPLISALPSECHVPGSPLLRSCGRAVPRTEVRVVDPHSLADVPPGAVGELWVRASRMMSGYWQAPAETAAAITADGWLRTGDAMHMDDDGFLYLHDRIKDVIVSGGENIYSAEVENALMGCDDIADCAVIGVPSKRWTETVKAVVVPSAGAPGDREALARDIIAFCKTQIASYKCPTSVDFTEVIPRTPSGKVRKHELRAPYWP